MATFMQELLNYCAPFSVEKLKLLSSGLEGTTYIAQAPQRKYILTHLKKPYQKEHAAEWALIYQYFSRLGAPLPSLLSLGQVQNSTVFLTTYAPGKTELQWAKKELKEVGKFLATFHQLSSRCPYTLANLPYPSQLQNDFAEIKPHLSQEFQDLEKEIEKIEKQWPSFLPKGIIHGDIWPKNVLFNEGTISSILHFTHPTCDLFLLDLARASKSFYFLEEREEFLAVLVEAYQTVRPLTINELESLDFMTSVVIISSIVRLLKQGVYCPEKRESLHTAALSHFYKWRA